MKRKIECICQDEVREVLSAPHKGLDSDGSAEIDLHMEQNSDGVVAMASKLKGDLEPRSPTTQMHEITGSVPPSTLHEKRKVSKGKVKVHLGL